MITESVKIKSEIVQRIRKQVKTSGQTISGFINLVLDHKLCQIEMDDKVVSESYGRIRKKK
jgi:hypothetical protein